MYLITSCEFEKLMYCKFSADLVKIFYSHMEKNQPSTQNTQKNAENGQNMPKFKFDFGQQISSYLFFDVMKNFLEDRQLDIFNHFGITAILRISLRKQ